MFNIHWVPNHRSAADKTWFAEVRPLFIKVVWGGPEAPYSEELPAGATYIYRDYNAEGGRGGLGANPEAFADQHAAAMRQARDYLLSRGLPPERILLESLNEPEVWTPNEAPDKIARYCVRFLDLVHGWGGHACVGNFGVGWPTNSGPDTPPNWEPFNAIRDHMLPGDYLGVHEYWALNGCGENWGWWAGRVLKCPWNVPILVTECGIDTYVAAMVPPRLGWHGLPGNFEQKAARYMDELWDYMGRLAQDERVQGVFPFTYDFGSNEWDKFDIRLDSFKEAMRDKEDVVPMPEPGAFEWGTTPPPIEPPPVEPLEIVNLVDSLPVHPTARYSTRAIITKTVLHYSWVTPPQPDRASEVAQIQSIARGHIRAGWPGIGYHFVIGPSGTVYQVNRLETAAYHASPHNSTSVGVCVLEREKPPTDEQVKSAAALINELGFELKLHKEISSTLCPGQYLGPLVRAAMAEPEPPPVEPPPPPPPPPPSPAFRVEHIPEQGHGLPLVVGNFPTVGAVLSLTWQWGAVGSAVAGSKPEWGTGGFEIYAGDDHSPHQLKHPASGAVYDVPMVTGKTSLCIWS